MNKYTIILILSVVYLISYSGFYWYGTHNYSGKADPSFLYVSDNGKGISHYFNKTLQKVYRPVNYIHIIAFGGKPGAYVELE